MSEKCHFIGIGGIGMSGLAKILLSKNMKVSGSDISHNSVIDSLTKAGAKVHIGHQPQNIEPNMTVIYTSQIRKDNPEYLAAIDKKCKLMHRSDLLYQIMQDYKTLAVSGTHGKTTTTALLTAVLTEAGLDPSFAVGGLIPQFETNAALGKGNYFIAEADESDGTFLKYHPAGAIVTNIDLDHMDYFGAIETLISAFKTFITQVQNRDLLFWCGDDPHLASLSPDGYCYGFNPENDIRGSNYQQNKWKSSFDIEFKGQHCTNIELPLVGKHNALNALAVFGMATQLGISEATIRKAFLNFSGVVRRCEKKGMQSGILVLDDYAHHPEEICVTLKGIRHAIEERRLVVVYQPHRYTRTRDCLGQFAHIFDEADLLFVTEIYSAGEEPIPGITHKNILQEVNGIEVPTNKLLQTVCQHLRPHDVVVTVGAGDITKLGHEIVTQLKKEPPKKWRVGLLFGGRSVENEISIRSAKFIQKNLNPECYEIEPFNITKEGNWDQGQGLSANVIEKLNQCDILFPVLHGTYGEDGTMQGLFEILGKPYVGCNHRSSAVVMDKALTKRIVILNGISTSPFVDFSYHDWKKDPAHYINIIHEQLRYPLFVKPVHLGSSIGITKVEKPENLSSAIEIAFTFDSRVIVENGLKIREIEFAVIGNDEVRHIFPGEVISTGRVLDYDAKYGPNAFEITKPDLPKEILEEGIFWAEKAYQALECTGLSRVDFFLDEQNRWWFNEINPMPGCTESSMFPQICIANGLKGEEIVDKLIILGFARNRRKIKV